MSASEYHGYKIGQHIEFGGRKGVIARFIQCLVYNDLTGSRGYKPFMLVTMAGSAMVERIGINQQTRALYSGAM